VHGAGNFPFRKEASTLDIELPDRADDTAYLAAVRQGCERALEHRPDIIYYVSGADAYEGDRLGRLGVGKDALAERDRIVLEAAVDTPVVLVMAGGYATNVDDTVDIHFNSVRAAHAYASRVSAISTSR
jgi:acetoin utilization deacetylase AcuC-like enzyme